MKLRDDKELYKNPPHTEKRDTPTLRDKLCHVYKKLSKHETKDYQTTKRDYERFIKTLKIGNEREADKL